LCTIGNFNEIKNNAILLKLLKMFFLLSATDKYGNIAPRCGFFHCFKKGECFVKKWDMVNEEFIDVSRAEIVRFKTNVLYFDDSLGPYPYEELEKWNSLSSLLTGRWRIMGLLNHTFLVIYLFSFF